jgi:hypothetical protein
LDELGHLIAQLGLDIGRAGWPGTSPTLAVVTESEWVDYQACPRDHRHVVLGDGCRLCEQPAPPSRALATVGKFHWLCWQQQLDWSDRFRPDRVLELTSADFVAWAEGDPNRHQQYLGFLGRSATFAPADFPRSTRGYLLSPGRPSTTVILQPDGTIVRPEHPRPGRWGCDPAGVLVLNVDDAQYRLVGDRAGLHTGRRVARGRPTGEPVLLGLWSDVATDTAIRLTNRSATALWRRSTSEFRERDLFAGGGPRVTIFGREQQVAVDAEKRRLAYRRGPDRVTLQGGPVYRGAGAYADWRLAFVRPLSR